MSMSYDVNVKALYAIPMQCISVDVCEFLTNKISTKYFCDGMSAEGGFICFCCYIIHRNVRLIYRYLFMIYKHQNVHALYSLYVYMLKIYMCPIDNKFI